MRRAKWPRSAEQGSPGALIPARSSGEIAFRVGARCRMSWRVSHCAKLPPCACRDPRRTSLRRGLSQWIHASSWCACSPASASASASSRRTRASLARSATPRGGQPGQIRPARASSPPRVPEATPCSRRPPGVAARREAPSPRPRPRRRCRSARHGRPRRAVARGPPASSACARANRSGGTYTHGNAAKGVAAHCRSPTVTVAPCAAAQPETGRLRGGGPTEQGRARASAAAPPATQRSTGSSPCGRGVARIIMAHSCPNGIGARSRHDHVRSINVRAQIGPKCNDRRTSRKPGGPVP